MYCAIFSEELPKNKNLERSTRLILGSSNENGEIEPLVLEDFLVHEAPYHCNSMKETAFLRSLLRKLDISAQVDFNVTVKRQNISTFPEKLKLLSKKVKYNSNIGVVV